MIEVILAIGIIIILLYYFFKNKLYYTFSNAIYKRLFDEYASKLPKDSNGNVILNTNAWDLDVIYRMGVLYMIQNNFKMAYLYFTWAKAIHEKKNLQLKGFDNSAEVIYTNLRFCEKPMFFIKWYMPKDKSKSYFFEFLLNRLGNKRYLYETISEEFEKERLKGNLTVDEFI